MNAKFSIQDRIVKIENIDKKKNIVTLQILKIVKSIKSKIEIPKVIVKDATDSEKLDNEDSSEKDAIEKDF